MKIWSFRTTTLRALLLCVSLRENLRAKSSRNALKIDFLVIPQSPVPCI